MEGVTNHVSVPGEQFIWGQAEVKTPKGGCLGAELDKASVDLTSGTLVLSND